MALSLASRETGRNPMTIAFGPSKQLIFTAVEKAGKFMKDHVHVSGKATTDEVTVTVRLRLRGRS